MGYDIQSIINYLWRQNLTLFMLFENPIHNKWKFYWHSFSGCYNEEKRTIILMVPTEGKIYYLHNFFETLESSNNKCALDDIYITNAIMCARQGTHYRGDNIDLKKSTLNCSEYLLKQIQIVKPKVILTLGYFPLFSLSKIFEFNIEKTLKEAVLKSPEIEIGNLVIIPLYHPVAQVKKDEQLKQYRRIWKYINFKKSSKEVGVKNE